jgi:GntR family transcriptional regulator
MDLRFDPSSAVPLFHQIAEAIRYRIAIGALGEGERMPGVREAAQQWQVHFHTVRRAYQALAAEGLLHMGPGKPTVVAGRGLEAANGDLRRFLAGVLQEGRARFGLSGQDLARHLAALDGLAAVPGPLWVVECSEGQAEAHAQEIRERWKVAARPWSMERPGEPPPGFLVATFFHFQEIRDRWPRRQGDLHFVAIHPDPGLPERVRERLGRNPRRVLLWEQDETMAANIAADLRTVFEPCGVPVEPRVLAQGVSVLEGQDGDEACLFAPRVWARLPAATRDDPRALEAAYRIRRADLEALGALLEGVSP